jgi:hypothetical protein
MNSVLNYDNQAVISTPKGSFQANGVEGAYIPLGHYKAHMPALTLNHGLTMHYSQHTAGK